MNEATQSASVGGWVREASSLRIEAGWTPTTAVAEAAAVAAAVQKPLTRAIAPSAVKYGVLLNNCDLLVGFALERYTGPEGSARPRCRARPRIVDLRPVGPELTYALTGGRDE